MKSFLLRLIVFVITLAVVVLVFWLGLFSRFSEEFTDKLFLKKAADPAIIIIAVDDESLNQIGSWPWPREVFAKALNNLQEAALIGVDINFSEPSRIGEKDDGLLATALSGLPHKAVLPVELDSRDKPTTLPLPAFVPATVQGFVNVPIGDDGVVRKTIDSRGSFSSFDYLLASSGAAGSESFRIAYRGPSGTFLTFSFNDLLEGKVPASVLKDSTVLLGVTAPDLHDILATPFGPMSGVEVHANVVQALKEGKYFQEISLWIDLLLFLITSALAFYVVRQVKSLAFIALIFLAAAALIYGAAAFLFTKYLILPAVYLLFDLILSVVVAVAYEYLSESKEKRFIRKSFQYYLPADVVNELMKDPEKLSLGGEAKELTVLFSDIRGFTGLSEALSPHDLTAVLNEYLTIMSDIIMDEAGLVDKYVGDAIMAFWGAPREIPNHAESACLGAKKMLEALPDFNKKMKERGWPALVIGIGLNTDTVVVGNMGSTKRFNYTVMGDGVNLASRLEGLTKYYKAGCIVGETTKKGAEKRKDLFFRPLDRVLVKGKKEPRRLYELLIKRLPQDLEKYYTSGLNFYEAGEWEKAINSFREAINIAPDGPSEVFLARSENFLAKPPSNWQGVYEFTVK